MDKFKLNTIEEAIEDFRNGEFIIVVDDEDRENEGDFIIAAEKITEIIFALPNTVEGKTTQHYIMSVLSDCSEVAFTELASGVPLGGELDYIDDGTLSLAFGGRKSL